MSWPSVQFDSIISDSAFGPRFAGELYDDDGNVATLRTTDLSEDGVISLGTMPCANIDEERFTGHFLQVGDLVISRSGRIGTTAIFDGYHKPVLPGAFLIRFRLDKEKADPLFFRYFFNSSVGQQRLLSVARGAAQQNINITNVKTLAVPLPPLSAQQEIATTLNLFDSLIENNRRRISILEQSARLLYREWFVYLRFPGHEHVKVVDGVPEGWAHRYISTIAEINTSSLSRKFDGEIEYIDIASVTTGSINETTRYAFADAPGRARRIVQHGDLIWSCVRPSRASYALVWHPVENLIASTGFCVIRPTKIPPTYLYFALSTQDFIGYLSNNAKGAAYPAVVSKDFENYEMLVPTPTLLDDFHGSTEANFHQIEVLKQQNTKLREARDLLLPRLMSGEIQV